MATREMVRLRRICAAQRGFATIAVLTLLIVSSLYSITARLNLAATAAPQVRQAQSIDVLSRAKAALIAFAAENVNRPGGLPCPDRDGDGEAELSCDRPEHRTGWYPWQTLKTGDLRDASGARLWYAVAAGFRNDPNVAINSLTPGELELMQGSGSARQRIASELVALVIGPGAPLPGQSRTGIGINRVDAWLEGENARADRTFESNPVGPAFNDVIVGISHAELFSVVDRVVASRIRREIAPLLREQVLGAWQSFPYAVPFSDPARSTFQDTTLSNSHEGLLPATSDSYWVHWDLGSVRIDRNAGVARADCSASVRHEIRCDIVHSGAAAIQIKAIARNVGRALVRPVSVDAADFGPSVLVARRVSHSPLDSSGSVTITASADLPAIGGQVRVTLRPPQPIDVFTNPRIPVAARHSWFARNQWHRVVYYAASPAAAPGESGADCEARPDRCLQVEGRDGKLSRSAALLVFMGRPDGTRSRAQPAVLASYLEGDNATPGDRSFRDGVTTSGFNDAVIVLCGSTSGGCK